LLKALECQGFFGEDMELTKAIFLGMIQGLTEFIPVSSSGHLVIVEHLLKVKMTGVSFEVCLHLGTFLSVVVIYWKRLVRMVKATALKMYSLFSGRFDKTLKDDWKLSYLIILGTIPAGILGVALKHQIENAFSSISLVAVMLGITGVILWLSGLAKTKKENVGLLDTIVIGLAQGFALLPGISRSGMTISAGMVRGIDKPKAAEFSFLLSLPAILGASVFEFSGLVVEREFLFDNIVFYLTGFLTAFIFGYIAIRLLLKVIQKGKFRYFGFYCLIMAISVLLFIR
jgi:undecaprenyl-diphosphatase